MVEGFDMVKLLIMDKHGKRGAKQCSGEELNEFGTILHIYTPFLRSRRLGTLLSRRGRIVDFRKRFA